MRKLLMLVLFLLTVVTLIGQTPAGIKYQAVLRDTRGNFKANTAATIKIDILDGGSSGSVVYSENHYVTTNMYGLIDIVIGNGSATKGTFSSIDWSKGTYFFKVYVDGIEMGTDQFMSVPYALHAETAEKLTEKIVETDPVYLSSPAFGITSNNISNWNTSFGWGNHATAGYLKSITETDPIFLASPSKGITSNNITNWNTAFNWGDHSKAGYLKSITETDPLFSASPAKGITTNNITNWTTAFGWGDHSKAGYLKNFAESDPIFTGWNKSTGIIITSDQVSDFVSSVENHPAVLANSAKISYPAADSKKLAGIQDSAEVNVNADWNATSGDAKILNKPTIPVGTNPGDIQYWNGTAWVIVPVGLPGQFLKLSASNVPEWSGILPTVTTTIATSITDRSSISGGIVTSDGAGTVTARGVCYGTSPSPTTANSIINNGTGSGSFISNVTGLSYATTYYVRAFATNSVGTNYGNEINFKTNPTLPTVTTSAVSDTTQTTATSGGNITNDGGAIVTARGVCWSITNSPTTADSKTTDGTATGTFTSSITGLTGNTTYFLRAYSTNSVVTSYGSEISFKTNPILPTLTTTAITAITQTTASSGGEITNNGGANITARGVCWSTSANPSTANSKTSNDTGTGTFTSNITGLTGNTTYYVRAYASNYTVTAYGNEINFKTNPTLPTVTTSAVSDTTQTTATSGGNITNDGGAIVTARGVCWSITNSPTTADSKTTDGTATGTFTSSITGLTGNTTYFLRAYSTNSVGTSYGSESSFTTLGGGVFTDSRDSHEYKWVKIGTQSWMAENLAYLPSVYPASFESSISSLYYVHGYEGSDIIEAKATSNYTNYGVLYNWTAAMNGAASSTSMPSGVQGTCPSGWHLPSDNEWTILTDYLANYGFGYGGSGNDIGKSMSSSSLWTQSSEAGDVGNDQSSNNTTGFNSFPGGDRYSGLFRDLSNDAFFWSTSVGDDQGARGLNLNYHINEAIRNNYHRKHGFSVRCIKD